MAQTKVGSFTLNTGTGNQSVTGVGFAPAAVIFLCSGQTSEATAASVMESVGVADRHGNRWNVASWSRDSDTYADSYFTSSRIYTGINVAMAVLSEAADITSLDADGFTVNVTVGGNAVVVYYYAIGGNDITDAAAGFFTVDPSLTVGSTQAITGVGFQPAAVMFGNCRSIANATTTEVGSLPPGIGDANFHVGFFDGATSAGAAHFKTNADASYRDSAQRTTMVFQVSNVFGVTMELRGLSLDSDGFTLESQGIADEANYCGFLAIEGGVHQVGNFNEKSSTGLQAVSTSGEPEGVMIVGGYNQGTNDPQANQAATYGFSDSDDDGSVGSSSSRGVFAAHDKARRNSNSVVAFIDAPSGLTGEADMDSFNPGNFTLDWTTADGVTRNMAFWVIGPPDTGFIPQIYRLVMV